MIVDYRKGYFLAPACKLSKSASANNSFLLAISILAVRYTYKKRMTTVMVLYFLPFKIALGGRVMKNKRLYHHDVMSSRFRYTYFRFVHVPFFTPNRYWFFVKT